MDPILEGVITGVVTAGVLGIIVGLWRKYREWRVRQLGDLMQRIIEHRNKGRHLVPDTVEWVCEARELEQEAIERAGRVSKASKRLIDSLGELKKFSVDQNVTDPNQQHWVNMLTTVISRIRDTLERHDK